MIATRGHKLIILPPYFYTSHPLYLECLAALVARHRDVTWPMFGWFFGPIRQPIGEWWYTLWKSTRQWKINHLQIIFPLKTIYIYILRDFRACHVYQNSLSILARRRTLGSPHLGVSDWTSLRWRCTIAKQKWRRTMMPVRWDATAPCRLTWQQKRARLEKPNYFLWSNYDQTIIEHHKG